MTSYQSSSGLTRPRAASNRSKSCIASFASFSSRSCAPAGGKEVPSPSRGAFLCLPAAWPRGKVNAQDLCMHGLQACISRVSKCRANSDLPYEPALRIFEQLNQVLGSSRKHPRAFCVVAANVFSGVLRTAAGRADGTRSVPVAEFHYLKLLGIGACKRRREKS